jgi:hypothetical protein
MTNSFKALGTAPTEDALVSARLHLEFYGGRVCQLVKDYPVVDGYKVRHQEVLPELIKFFKEEGWSFSGSGFFSAVFVRKGLALKVGLKTEDSGATYAAWCRANQGRPAVPTIYAIEKFRRCYVVLMERCFPLYKDIPSSRDPRVHAECAMLTAVIDGAEPVAGFPATLTAKSIRAFFEGIATFDLHTGNVMLDRMGEVVITDPVSVSHRGTEPGDYYDYYTEPTTTSA